MRAVRLITALTFAFVAIFFFDSCCPKPNIAAEPSTYTLDASTGDTYIFEILPKDPNEFEDEVASRKSNKKAIVSIKPEAKVAVPSYDDDDLYCGNDRADSKTSLNEADFETFDNLNQFLETLPTDNRMRSIGITRAPNSKRVQEEIRNVAISRTYIYAIKHEPDKDYHIIIGDKAGKIFFNVEVTGLPEETSPDFEKLLIVRTTVKSFFDKRVRITEKYNRSDPPIPIKIYGSLFYDIDHAPGIVGPTGMRPKTAWEIHPVSTIIFLKRTE